MDCYPLRYIAVLGLCSVACSCPVGDTGMPCILPRRAHGAILTKRFLRKRPRNPDHRNVRTFVPDIVPTSRLDWNHNRWESRTWRSSTRGGHHIHLALKSVQRDLPITASPRSQHTTTATNTTAVSFGFSFATMAQVGRLATARRSAAIPASFSLRLAISWPCFDGPFDVYHHVTTTRV